MTVDQQFNTINEKVQLLLRQYGKLQKENEKLQQELERARKEEEDNRQKLEELQQQISILKMSSGDWNEKDKKEFEKKINQYIREIDKCIAYLSQ